MRVRPLKICFISEPLRAGVGRHLVDLIDALAKRGHEVHLLYSPTRMNPSFLDAIGHAPNVRCEAVPMPHAIGGGDIAAFRRIKRYVRANGPFDVIHGHSAKGGGYARLLRLFGFGRVVYTPHAFITASPAISWMKRLGYHAIESILARLTDRVVCLSHAEEEQARRLGIAFSQLAVVLLGIAAIRQPPRELVRKGLGIAPDQIVVGFVGRMEDQKAPERMVFMALQLLPRLPELFFLMIGDGPKRAPLEAELAQAGFASRAKWLGAVDAQAYLTAIDILVVPSLYEGFAYVLLEGLNAGLPIVSMPVGGAEEAIENGVNGFIVPQNNLSEMSAAVRRLASDRRLRAAMAAASRARIDSFSVERMTDAMESLYLAIAKNRAPLRQATPLSAAEAGTP